MSKHIRNERKILTCHFNYDIITSKARCAFENIETFLNGLCTVSAMPKCRRLYLVARAIAKRRMCSTQNGANAQLRCASSLCYNKE